MRWVLQRATSATEQYYFLTDNKCLTLGSATGQLQLLGQLTPAAAWQFETANAPLVRLKNVATGTYLNVETGLPLCSSIQPGWLRALWMVAP